MPRSARTIFISAFETQRVANLQQIDKFAIHGSDRAFSKNSGTRDRSHLNSSTLRLCRASSSAPKRNIPASGIKQLRAGVTQNWGWEETKVTSGAELRTFQSHFSRVVALGPRLATNGWVRTCGTQKNSSAQESTSPPCVRVPARGRRRLLVRLCGPDGRL
jgi:hypothetical protein